MSTPCSHLRCLPKKRDECPQSQLDGATHLLTRHLYLFAALSLLSESVTRQQSDPWRNAACHSLAWLIVTPPSQRRALLHRNENIWQHYHQISCVLLLRLLYQSPERTGFDMRYRLRLCINDHRSGEPSLLNVFWLMTTPHSHTRISRVG